MLQLLKRKLLFIYFLTIWTVSGNLFHSFRNIMIIIALYLDCDLLLKC